MQDAWRAYLELALGLTEASRKKAAQVIKSLADQSGEKVEDLQGMAEELLNTSVANRDNVVKLIRFELDRALAKVGLATNEEVDELAARVQQLEIELREAREQAGTAGAAGAAASAHATAKKTAPQKTAKKTAAKKAVAKKATTKKAAAKTTAKKAAAKKTAKKATKDT